MMILYTTVRRSQVGDAVEFYIPSHAPAGRGHDDNGLAGLKVHPNPVPFGCDQEVNAYTTVEVEVSTESLPVEASDEKLCDSAFATADFDYIDHVWAPRARPLREKDFHGGVVFNFLVGFAGRRGVPQ